MTDTEPRLWDALDDEAEVLPAIAGDRGQMGQTSPNWSSSKSALGTTPANSNAANTLRAYESDLRHFGEWCETRGLVAFPPTAETVAYYLTDHAGVVAVSTLRRRLAAISEGTRPGDI